MTTVGNLDDATAALRLHCGEWDEVPYADEWQQIGSGSQRTVYLAPDEPIVYKVGHDTANRCETDTLRKLREEGKGYAPEATLWTIQYESPYVDESVEEITVVAMPYLPEDGSVPHDGTLLPGAADLNGDNVVSNGGRLWLIDAGGM